MLKKRILLMILSFFPCIFYGCSTCTKKIMPISDISLDAGKMERDNFVLMDAVHQSSSTKRFLFNAVQLVDDSYLKIFGIPLFEEQYAFQNPSNDSLSFIDSLSTAKRAYYKAVSAVPESDVLLQKSCIVEKKGLPFIFSYEKVSLTGRAVKVKNDRELSEKVGLYQTVDIHNSKELVMTEIIESDHDHITNNQGSSVVNSSSEVTDVKNVLPTEGMSDLNHKFDGQSDSNVSLNELDKNEGSDRFKSIVASPSPAVSSKSDLLAMKSDNSDIKNLSGNDEPFKNNENLEIVETINNWKLAWSSLDADRYLSFYASDFRIPSNKSRKAWEKERKLKLKKKFISISLHNIEVVFDSNSLAKVTFDQDYQSNNYQDSTKKQIVLQRIGIQWKILEEKVIKIY